MNPRSKLILHPILFGIYPVLFAYAHNIDFAPPATELLILVALFGAAAAALWWTAARAFGDIPKAAVATSLSIVVFFSYGHLAKLVGVPLAHFQIFSISFGENRAPALIWTVLVVLLALWVRRLSRQKAAAATVVLDRVGIALIALIVL